MAAVGDNADSMEMGYEDENIWLTQKKMTVLNDVDVRTVNEHLKKIYSDGELTLGGNYPEIPNSSNQRIKAGES